MYRKLTSDEIDKLQQHSCTADDWSQIDVDENFVPEHIFRIRFTGEIKLGKFEKTFQLPGGISVHSGLEDAVLHSCIVGNDVFIGNIKNYVANYTIADDVFIQNVDALYVDGETSFGNGVKVSVLNENGGRAIPMFDNMSAHLAYLMVLYRYNQNMVQALENLIADFVDSKTSAMGIVENNATIVNSGTIKNVFIGNHAEINGALSLENGSINSELDAPAKIGQGVQCRDFIISSGTVVDEASMLEKCFVGQACEISKQFSAIDSLFFANCHLFNGEATAVFAGPYTVSHHKSTLLIAGLFSFFNAGSGSNQSNHLYKLGPVHQGITGRGVKFASSSYVMWPARVGVFSVVMGHHFSHADTDELPFSYLMEKDDKTYVIPGINLCRVGIMRDVQKWPLRDNRLGEKVIDQIGFGWLSPFTVEKIVKGISNLEYLLSMAENDDQTYDFNGCKIYKKDAERGLYFYHLAYVKYLGDSFFKHLDENTFYNEEQLINFLMPALYNSSGDWVDLSGLMAPKSEVASLISEIGQETLTLQDIQLRFEQILGHYADYEWAWTFNQMLTYWHKSKDEITLDDLQILVQEWQKASNKMDAELKADVMKEFNTMAMTGFGVDGDDDDKINDFEQVRGDFEHHSVTRKIVEHMEETDQLADEFIANIEKMK